MWRHPLQNKRQISVFCLVSPTLMKSHVWWASLCSGSTNSTPKNTALAHVLGDREGCQFWAPPGTAVGSAAVRVELTARPTVGYHNIGSWDLGQDQAICSRGFLSFQEAAPAGVLGPNRGRKPDHGTPNWNESGSAHHKLSSVRHA